MKPKFTRKSTAVAILLVLLVLIAASISACSAQTQTSWGGDVVVDEIPKDVCFNEDGTPKVLGVNIENSGDIAIIYIDNKGDLVTQHYGGGAIGIGTAKQGTLTFTGDGSACPN